MSKKISRNVVFGNEESVRKFQRGGDPMEGRTTSVPFVPERRTLLLLYTELSILGGQADEE